MKNELTFQPIENSVVILSKGGMHSQHEAYHRRGEIFAKMGSGYVGLRRTGTSKPGVVIKDYDLGGQDEFSFVPTGRVVFADHPEATGECARVFGNPSALPEPDKTVTVKKHTRKK